jgi:hypothetical protein
MNIVRIAASRRPGDGFHLCTSITPLMATLLAFLLAGCAGQESAGSVAPAASASPDVSTAKSEEGLKALNEYRLMEKLPPVVNEPVYGAGDQAHAYYLVKNYKQEIKDNRDLGINFHLEDRNKPYYTLDGFIAGRASDVVSWTGGSQGASEAIDEWMLAVFHRFPLLDPQLRKVGYGEYCEDQACAAALNIQTGANSAWTDYNRRLSAGGPLGSTDPTAEDSTVEFPPDGSSTSFTQFDGNEWPDPLSACPGYKPPTGPPLSVQTGAWIKTRLNSCSVTANGVKLETRGIDSDSYTNPDMLEQRDGSNGLEAAGAVILIPRQPLDPGTVYNVTADVNGRTYKWSFKAAGRVM